MKTKINKLTLILVIILIPVQYCFSKVIPRDNNVKITYIANEGFLIKVKDKTILIDALFGDKEYGFCDIPVTSQLELMKNAKEDFENIDLIAATHCHDDHFYASFVVDHLANNKHGKFISTEQTIDQIKEIGNYNENIKAQLVEITPDSLTYNDTIINGIEIRVYRLIHGPYYVNDPETGKRINRHQNIQNLGFLFNINGIKIFHCGDSNSAGKLDYECFRLDKENIDISFLDREFMWSKECAGIDVIKNYIKPKHIVLMHIHHDQNKSFIDVANTLTEDFPSVKIFEKQMETKTYIIQ